MTEEEINDAKMFVQNQLDGFLKGNVLDHVNWMIYAYPLAELRDVALGYVIGLIEGKYLGYCLLRQITGSSELKVKHMDVARKVIKDNLPKIIEKIEKDFCARE